MSDRPDLIQSELSGLAFDALQQCFRSDDIEAMMTMQSPPIMWKTQVYIIIDPAAGGPQSDFAVLSMVREKGLITVIGIDTLGGSKEPERQYDLLQRHINRIRDNACLRFSPILVLVERNLGFESEHIKRSCAAMEGVTFYYDDQGRRTGVLTTDKVKLGAMTLLNLLLRERRVHILPHSQFISEEPKQQHKRLRDQLGIYSMQFKIPDTVFQRGRYALSGKVGGMKDDVVICLQLGIYWTETGRLGGKQDVLQTNFNSDFHRVEDPEEDVDNT
eukprot:2101700-Rhodomonas_salina.4